MDDKYAALQRQSYAGQETSFTFPEQEGITHTLLGFQPLGISIFGSTVAIADYFGPSVMLAEVSLTGGVPHFSDIRWVRGTIAEGKCVRMFPNLYQPGGVNRMQVVLMYSPIRLGLIRNAERKIFPITLRADGGWWNEPVSPLPAGGLDMVHSAVLVNQGLVTVESDEKAERWAVYDYRYGSAKRKGREIAPFHYGIAVRDDGEFITVSDYRAKEHGLYIDDKRRVPGLTGNGVALIDGGKGGALVTRYGHGHPGPFNGVPGALFFVPPQLLN